MGSGEGGGWEGAAVVSVAAALVTAGPSSLPPSAGLAGTAAGQPAAAAAGAPAEEGYRNHGEVSCHGDTNYIHSYVIKGWAVPASSRAVNKLLEHRWLTDYPSPSLPPSLPPHRFPFTIHDGLQLLEVTEFDLQFLHLSLN